MDHQGITLQIASSINCPLYQEGECFILSDKAIFHCDNKPACLSLCADLLENNPEKTSDFHIACRGCNESNSRVSLVCQESEPFEEPIEQQRTLSNIASILSGFSLFKSLDENQTKDVISLIKLGQFRGGTYILKAGEPVKNLYIILSGTAEVTGEDGITLATLTRGEVFGEMSLLSGKTAGASVRALGTAKDATKVLYFTIPDFKILMMRFPSLQMYLARLLTKRLAKTNVARSKEFSSGMHGSLVDTPIAELCQIINLNRKTGVLSLNLSNDTGRISFRDGNIITATYGEKNNKEAFFKILKDTKGIFTFTSNLPEEDAGKPVMANFMNLLLEGVSRMDDGKLSS
jgi:CRP/FNR family transcriptional regulator, cyclic AMP receptor protein